MYCGRCGKGNTDDVRYCVHCGAELLSQTPTRPGPADTLDFTSTVHADALRAGKVLAGQYRILGNAPLGSGGMGEVWKAEDTELGTVVAVKVLPPALARDPGAIANLKREAMIGQQLSHRHICRLHGLHSDGAVKFLVMEYVNGKTLSQVLAERDGRRMTWEDLEPIARQVAEALDYAHVATYTDAKGRQVKGVLHRDIKPQNIMVTQEGVAKLMDFGIAREIHNSMTQVTGRTSQTPLYASPEQFRGDPMTAASDVYSFAAVLYECLAGRPCVNPHGDLKYQILEKPHEPLTGQSEGLKGALAKGLAKQPGDRPTTCRGLLAEASRKETAHRQAERGASEAPNSTEVVPRTVPRKGPTDRPGPKPSRRPKTGAVKPSAAEEPAERRAPPRRRRTGRKVVLVLCVLALLGGLVYYGIQESGRTRPHSTPQATHRSKRPPSGPVVSSGLLVPAGCRAAAGSPSVTWGGSQWAKEVVHEATGMELAFIPAGSFMMGSPTSEEGHQEDETQHRVTLTKPFYLGKYEVTQGEWTTVVGSNPSHFKGSDKLPVESVSWDDCQAFCRKAGLRLPTEAEWEYACRAETTTPFNTGATISTDEANYDGDSTYGSGSKGVDREKTVEVGSFEPNAWGLYDMHGNVWEWCADWYGEYPSGSVTDPPGPSSGSNRVLRGGSWISIPWDCRSAYRNRNDPDGRYDISGFRAAVDLK